MRISREPWSMQTRGAIDVYPAADAACAADSLVVLYVLETARVRLVAHPPSVQCSTL